MIGFWPCDYRPRLTDKILFPILRQNDAVFGR